MLRRNSFFTFAENVIIRMSQEQLKPVYLDRIFKDKNPQLYKLLPGFVLRYLKKIIHQDDLNVFIDLAKDKYGPDFAEAYLQYGDIKVKIVGEENLPNDDERVIFASNHPLGGLDGIAAIDKLGHRYPTMKFMVNDILMQLLNLRPVFLPINKHGGQAREAARKIIEAHQGDAHIFTFPAGLVSRRQNGVIKDLKWGKNVITNAIRYERDIIPLHISGRNSNFFYNLGEWRKRLGIKVNIEMLYLVDEVWNNHHTEIVITVGKPISYKTFTKEKSREQWAESIKAEVYALTS